MSTQDSLSGWWFGTFFYFSVHWEFHHPNWLSCFSEGLNPPTSSILLFQPLKLRLKHPMLGLAQFFSGWSALAIWISYIPLFLLVGLKFWLVSLPIYILDILLFRWKSWSFNSFNMKKNDIWLVNFQQQLWMGQRNPAPPMVETYKSDKKTINWCRISSIHSRGAIPLE